jgi:hypothetical protein
VYWWQGRHLTFFYDEWAFITDRRSGGPGSFLDAHNGHPSVLPVAWYRVLFATVGLDTYVPYRAAVLVIHLACATLVYAYARRRAAPVLALCLAALLLFMGSAWQNTMWAFQVGFLGSVAAGVGALLVLERRSPGRDVVAGGLLAVSLLSSGIGLPFLAAAGAQVLVGPDRWWRLARLLPVPVLAYGLWHLGYGDPQGGLDRLPDAPGFMFTAAAGALAGLVGASIDWGRAFLGAGAALLVVAVVQRRRLPSPLAGAVVGGCSFWLLTAIGRGADPTASRYLYIGAVFALLAAAELARGLPVPTWLAVVVVVAAALGVRANLGQLDAGTGGLETVSRAVEAELAAVELARDVVPADFRPDPAFMPTVTAGPYLAAVDALGSPALDEAELAAAGPDARARADRVLVDALGVGARPGPAGQARCAPAGPEVQLGPGTWGLALSQPAQLTVRRFGPEGAALPLGEPLPAGPVQLTIPADRSDRPWLVGAGGAALGRCG